MKLTGALGKNGRVISDIIPEIRLIIGEQPELIELPPEEAKNRFNIVFQKFVRVFCAAEHPLVIFLDDLQWADLPSLKLLEALMIDADLKHILLIGAYRDNEVNEIHPLIDTLNTLQNENTPVNIIRLKPLSLVHIRQLLEEFLKHNLETVAELADVCIEKTEGNPFFLNQFLYELYCKDLIRFKYDLREWQWDLPGIKNAGITDNVVDFIADRLRKLASEIQETLKIAACIGNNFDLKTLSVIREKTAQQIYNELQEAIREGILTEDYYPYNQSEIDHIRFAFIHDRIQQAAYALITEAELPKVHLTIGRLLLLSSAM